MSYDQEKTQAPPDDYRLKEMIDRRREHDDRCNEIAGQIGTQPGRPMSSEEIVAEFFKYHPPTPATLPKFNAINQAAKNFAEVVLANCPSGTDRCISIQRIREARMAANSAISLNGLSLY